ncbi:MAG: hypothetical protein ACREQV_14050, partial [Candidatus Binatia bacterium]
VQTGNNSFGEHLNLNLPDPGEHLNVAKRRCYSRDFAELFQGGGDSGAHLWRVYLYSPPIRHRYLAQAASG